MRRACDDIIITCDDMRRTRDDMRTHLKFERFLRNIRHIDDVLVNLVTLHS